MRAALLIVAGLGLLAATVPASAAAREHTQRVQRGALRAEFSYSDRVRLPGHSRIRIWSHGRLIVNRLPRFGGPGYAERAGKPVTARALSIRQLDGTGPPEVVLNLFSGGAHCCWTTLIFTGAHRTTKQWGDTSPLLKDADGDGKPEFHAVDTSFAYAFTSFAGSRFPAQVWKYADGRMQDITPSFPAEVQANFDQQFATYQTAREAHDPGGVRGALAAYAADGYSLGRGDPAMAVVQAAVDAGEAGTKVTQRDPFWEPNYVGALRDLLRKGGYDRSAA